MAVSATFTEELFKQQTSIALFTLIEISHADFTSTIYLVDNNEAITFGGQSYSPMALSFDMPPEEQALTSSAYVQLDNVDRTIVYALRSITTLSKPTVTVTIVSDLNGTITLERGPYNFQLNSISYDVSTIKLELSYNDELVYKFPYITMTPDNCPALFK